MLEITGVTGDAFKFDILHTLEEGLTAHCLANCAFDSVCRSKAKQCRWLVPVFLHRWAFGCVSLPLLTIQLLGWTQPASMGAGDDYHWAVLASQIVNAVPSPVRKILQYEGQLLLFCDDQQWRLDEF